MPVEHEWEALVTSSDSLEAAFAAAMRCVVTRWETTLGA